MLCIATRIFPSLFWVLSCPFSLLKSLDVTGTCRDAVRSFFARLCDTDTGHTHPIPNSSRAGVEPGSTSTISPLLTVWLRTMVL